MLLHVYVFMNWLGPDAVCPEHCISVDVTSVMQAGAVGAHIASPFHVSVCSTDEMDALSTE